MNLPFGVSHGVYSTLKANDPFTDTNPKRVHAFKTYGNVSNVSFIFITSVDGGDAGKAFVGFCDTTAGTLVWNQVRGPETKQFHVGTTAPSNTNLLWIDTANGLKYHNGTDWVIVPVAYS
jgi:hypothetical protein